VGSSKLLLCHGGFGAIAKAVLYASVPVLLPPGTEDGGVHLSVRPEMIDAIAKTYPVNLAVEPPSRTTIAPWQ
jgi:hypothetical protein